MKTRHERNVELIHKKQLERNMLLCFEQEGMESRKSDNESCHLYKHDSGVGYPMRLPVIMNDHNEYEYRRCYRGERRDY